jgi:hypothetical protein
VLVRHFFTVRRNSIIQLFCLIDEHDGNVFTDLVEKPAALANQAVFFFGEPYLPFAFGAGKDIKQFLADHGAAPADGDRWADGVVFAGNNTGIDIVLNTFYFLQNALGYRTFSDSRIMPAKSCVKIK